MTTSNDAHKITESSSTSRENDEKCDDVKKSPVSEKKHPVATIQTQIQQTDLQVDSNAVDATKMPPMVVNEPALQKPPTAITTVNHKATDWTTIATIKGDVDPSKKNTTPTNPKPALASASKRKKRKYSIPEKLQVLHRIATIPGYSQSDAARELGIGRGLVSEWKKGEANLRERLHHIHRGGHDRTIGPRRVGSGGPGMPRKEYSLSLKAEAVRKILNVPGYRQADASREYGASRFLISAWMRDSERILTKAGPPPSSLLEPEPATMETPPPPPSAVMLPELNQTFEMTSPPPPPSLSVKFETSEVTPPPHTASKPKLAHPKAIVLSEEGTIPYLPDIIPQIQRRKRMHPRPVSSINGGKIIINDKQKLEIIDRIKASPFFKQADAARELGISRKRISEWMKAEKRIRIRVANTHRTVSSESHDEVCRTSAATDLKTDSSSTTVP